MSATETAIEVIGEWLEKRSGASGRYPDAYRKDAEKLVERLRGSQIGFIYHGERKRAGCPPNTEGCQSRLYWSHGVAAKCCLGEDHGGPHHNGTRTWLDSDAVVNAARFGRTRSER